MRRFITFVGASTISALSVLGRLIIFKTLAFWSIFRPPFYEREFLLAAFNIGYLSLPVVGLTAVFTGAALVLQIYAGGARFNAEAVVPQIVAIGMVRELGPVLVGLMIAARVTSSIAAELATMKVTEQIDALIALSTNPMQYLVAPRLLAACITVPLLVGVGDIIGILGGFTIATQSLGFNAASYLKNTAEFLTSADIISSLVKGLFFGAIAALMGCYFGLNAARGAQGVGSATKSSVEAAAILILSANFILTAVFFSA